VRRFAHATARDHHCFARDQLFVDLIEELCEEESGSAFLNSSGKPLALITSPMLTATVETSAARNSPHARVIAAPTYALDRRRQVAQSGKAAPLFREKP